MTKEWSQEEEAARLGKRFEGLNQAKFARTHKVPGGASMVSQHIKGHRPINLAAAMAYARGFKVQLEEISPRLARAVREGATLATKSEAPASNGTVQLDERERQVLEDYRKISREARTIDYELSRFGEHRGEAYQAVVEYLQKTVRRRFPVSSPSAPGDAKPSPTPPPSPRKTT